MIRQLSGKLLEKAKAELNEDPDRIDQDLDHIEEWLKKQPHLTVKKDRQYLLNFLRSSKFSLQRAKEKIDYFYSAKSMIPEFYNKNPQSPEMEIIIKGGVIAPMTKTSMGQPFPTILVMNWKRADPEKMPYVNLFRALLMYYDVLLQENDNFSVCGCYVLCDMKGFSLNYVKQFTPTVCMRVVTTLQNAYPYRLKGVIFMNMPKVYEVIVHALWPFLSTKIRERFKIFNENETDKLYDIIPKEYLPKDFGGEGQSIEELTAEWHQILINYRDWFREENECGCDEAKKIGSPIISEMLGIEGSFRNLNVD